MTFTVSARIRSELADYLKQKRRHEFVDLHLNMII